MKNYDIVILGSGPAGISAGIYSCRAAVKTLVIDSGESALKRARRIDNYYGIESISGEELFSRGIEQYKKLGGEYIKSEVLKIKNNLDEHTYTIETKAESFTSKAVILALGAGKKKTVQGLEKFEGANVSYCAVCDGFFYRGKDVAVIGDGDFAVNEAEELSKNAKTVYLISKNAIKNAKLSKNIVICNKNIKSFEGKGVVEEVVLDDNSKLKIDGVFVALGSLSSFELAKQLGLLMSGDYIFVDKAFMTNIAGVFACGDAVGGLLQVSKAVGEGAQAAIEAIRYIKIMEENGERED